MAKGGAGPKTSAPRQRESRGIVIGINELTRLRKRFEAVAEELTQDRELAEAVGHQQVTSAKRRISETKRSPSGKPWASWSKSYAQTRNPNQHSLLVGEGKLLDSLAFNVVSASEVHVGSNMPYARANLFQRPYLDTEPGFQDAHDRAELRDILREFFQAHGLK